ncbi:MAG: hypothetical protein AAFR76_15900, partial [Planctomycetota bacterium]
MRAVMRAMVRARTPLAMTAGRRMTPSALPSSDVASQMDHATPGPLLFLSPYALVEDEAHYWEWALRLDWSYYSKGPGVAWSIWLATSLLGNAEGVIR